MYSSWLFKTTLAKQHCLVDRTELELKETYIQVMEVNEKVVHVLFFLKLSFLFPEPLSVILM